MIERLGLWLHEKPLGERIKANRVLITLVWLLLTSTFIFSNIYFDYRSEGMQKADQQARLIASSLLQPVTPGIQAVLTQEPSHRERKCIIRLVVPLDEKTSTAEVLALYGSKLTTEGWTQAKSPKSLVNTVLYRQGEKESVVLQVGENSSNILVEVQVNIFSFEQVLNVFYAILLFICIILTLAVFWAWKLDWLFQP